MAKALDDLAAAKVSVWLDDLSRPRIQTDRYRAVLDAFLTGLEQRKAVGGSLVGIESVASFFISRVDRKWTGSSASWRRRPLTTN
jgi:hypothetical protein